MLYNLKKYLEKRIRPTSFLGFFVYNIYYNLGSFYKQFYFFYKKGDHYMGYLWIYGKEKYKFHLSCKSAIAFIYELYIKNLYLDKLKLNKGDYVLDVGANAGLFAVLASKEVGNNGKVICFEPSKDNIVNIKKNLKFNNIKNVIIIPKGTYSKKTELKFYIHNEDFCNSIFEDEFKNEKNIKKILKIKVDTVENILKSFKVDYRKINFVKLDNEGAEFETLKGMKKLLKMKRLKLIVPDLKKDDNIYLDVLKILKDNNFKILNNKLPRVFSYKNE